MDMIPSTPLPGGAGVQVDPVVPTTMGPNVNFQTLAIQVTGGAVALTLWALPQSVGLTDVREIGPFSFLGSFTWGAPVQGFSAVSVDPSNPGFLSAQGYLPGDPVVPGGAIGGGAAPISPGGIDEITSADSSVTVTDPFGPITDLSAPGSTPLETTDGVTTISPTTELLIGVGITLTNPSAGVAELTAAGGGSGWAFNTDNEGGWGSVKSNAAGPSGYGLFFGDESGNGVGVISENDVVLDSTTGDAVLIGTNQDVGSSTASVVIGKVGATNTIVGGTTVSVQSGAGGVSVTDTVGTIGATVDSAASGPVNIGVTTTGNVTLGSVAALVTIGGTGETLVKGAGSVTVDGTGSFAVLQSNGGADGCYIDGAGNSYLYASSFQIQINETSGFTLIGLPTAAGMSGTLWNNAGVVSVAP